MTDGEARSTKTVETRGPVECCGFCGAPLDDEAEYVRDPFDGAQKWVCSDASACADRGRKP